MTDAISLRLTRLAPPPLRALLLSVALAAMTSAGPALAQSSEAAAHLTAANDLVAADQLRILDIIARMNQAVDLEDYALYASFYAADGVIDSGFGDPVEGHEAIVASLEQSAPFITNKRHAAANVVLTGSGDEATAVYYLIVFERVAGLTLAGTAVITDTFARRDGDWRVTRHQTRMDPATLASMQ